jgi:anti-anti-sigma factor
MAERPYRHIAVERKKDVFCVRLRRHQMEEADILEMADEVLSLINDQGCRKMVFSMGPEEVECLYSVFLAKLVMVRRQLVENGGALKISEASPDTIGVFEACHLKDLFDFVPDQETGVASLTD